MTGHGNGPFGLGFQRFALNTPHKHANQRIVSEARKASETVVIGDGRHALIYVGKAAAARINKLKKANNIFSRTSPVTEAVFGTIRFPDFPTSKVLNGIKCLGKTTQHLKEEKK